MEYNIDNLSVKELKALQIAINSKLKEERMLKSDLALSYGLAHYDDDSNWRDEIKNVNPSFDDFTANKWFRNAELSILSLCDFALNNMQVKNNTLVRNDKIIPKHMQKDYTCMANELQELVIKWHKTAIKNGYSIANVTSDSEEVRDND